MKELSRDQMRLISGGSDGDGAARAAASATAVGAGVGGVRALEAAGSLGALGQAAPAVAGTIAAGFIGALSLGAQAGSWLYDNSEPVREISQGTWENIDKKGFGATLWEGTQGLMDILWGGHSGEQVKYNAVDVNYE
jgi:hypothetical protein